MGTKALKTRFSQSTKEMEVMLREVESYLQEKKNVLELRFKESGKVEPTNFTEELLLSTDLNWADMVANFILTLFAGHDTTTNILSSTTILFITQPGVLEALR